eukprot:14724441-Alexandrium_andersonii.AAC.1
MVIGRGGLPSRHGMGACVRGAHSSRQSLPTCVVVVDWARGLIRAVAVTDLQLANGHSCTPLHLSTKPWLVASKAS